MAALDEMVEVDAALTAAALRDSSDPANANQALDARQRDASRGEHDTSPLTGHTQVTNKVKTGPSTQGFARVSNEGGLIDIITQSEIQSTDRGVMKKDQQNVLQNRKGSDPNSQSGVPPIQLRGTKFPQEKTGTQMLTPIVTEKSDEEIHSEKHKALASNAEDAPPTDPLSPATYYKNGDEKDDSDPQLNSNP